MGWTGVHHTSHLFQMCVCAAIWLHLFLFWVFFLHREIVEEKRTYVHELEVCGARFSSFRTVTLLVAFNLWRSNNIQDTAKVNECFLHTKQLNLTSTGSEFAGPWRWFYSEIFMPWDLITDFADLQTPPDHVAAGKYHISEAHKPRNKQEHTNTHTSDAITVKWWHQSLAAVQISQ